MSEPMNDMSLRETPYLDIWPLEPMSEETDPEMWCHHVRTDGKGAICEARLPLRVNLPGVRLLNCTGIKWACKPGEILVSQGYRWDGASGPAINDDAALMGSLVHDIICARIVTADGTTHPLPSYTGRHTLYARILRAQGAPVWRVGVDWIGLMAANWVLMLQD